MLIMHWFRVLPESSHVEFKVDVSTESLIIHISFIFLRDPRLSLLPISPRLLPSRSFLYHLLLTLHPLLSKL